LVPIKMHITGEFRPDDIRDERTMQHPAVVDALLNFLVEFFLIDGISDSEVTSFDYGLNLADSE